MDEENKCNRVSPRLIADTSILLSILEDPTRHSLPVPSDSSGCQLCPQLLRKLLDLRTCLEGVSMSVFGGLELNYLTETG